MAVAVYPLLVVLLSLALLLLIATNKTYQYTFGVLLAWLAKQFRSVSVGLFGFGGHPFGFIADAIDDANNYVLRKIAEGITSLEGAVSWTWGNMIATIQELGKLLSEIPHETGRALHLLYHVAVPRIVRAAIGDTPALVHAARKDIAALYKAGAHVIGLTAREVHHLIAQAIAVPFPLIRGLERKIAAETKRLSRLEKGAIIGTAVGVVSFALSKLGLGSLRCSNNRNATKGVCGMNPSLLESLLADTLLIVGTVSLVDFAKGLQPIVAEIEKPIRVFWRAA